MPGSPIEVFYSYAHEDELLRIELEKHLSLLRQQGLIAGWHDRHILAGTDWVQAIDTHLERATVILLLVSADFLASDYCYSIEVQRALERHEAKLARVIPVLLRPVEWQGAPFAHLQVLPSNAKAITIWNNQDEAFMDVAAGLRSVIKEVSQLAVSTPSSFPHVWNLPYLRNPFFTGRDEILTLLHNNYAANSVAASLQRAQAISGLGGIGKTQVALEYAYRYGREYECALWIRATTRDALSTDFITIANLLQLSEKNEKNLSVVIEAVKQWLAIHTRWLLILDNVDDLELVHNFLLSRGSGHILLTTRMQTMSGIAKLIEVEIMTPEEGALFLLRRANIIEPDAQLEHVSEADRTQAMAISKVLGGLPLALDQAGAYIEETASSLSEYTVLYNTQRTALLRERGGFAIDHPESVATTWSLSFAKLSAANPATIELLRLLVFLHPDAIPEEIMTEGASELGIILQPIADNPFSLNAVIRELLRYSLIRRNPSAKTVSIHRLLQAILKDEMDEATQRLWAERAVRAVNRAFPHTGFAMWQRCQRSLPHAQACAILINHWKFAFPGASRLLHLTGFYLYARGQYTDAEPFLLQALKMREQILDPQHPDIATSLNNLAGLYQVQGKYTQAEPLYLRALEIQEQVLGPNHASVATSLNDVATLYRLQGRFVEADQLFQRALLLREQVLGSGHPDIACSFSDLASLYYDQGKYDQAEPLFQRALAIREQALGAQHPEVAAALNNLALLYVAQKKYAQAEPLYQRALVTRKQILGPKHPDIATSLNNLAGLYIYQGKYHLAIPLLEESLAIREGTLGPEHPRVAGSLSNLANLYLAQSNYAQAEPLLQRSLIIREQLLGVRHPDVAITLRNLAQLYRAQQQYAQAEALYLRALSIQETTLGSRNPLVMQTLKDMAELYRDQGEYTQAEPLYQRALAMREQEPGQYNSDLISILESYAVFLQQDRRIEAAEQVLLRIQELRTKEG
ncbi:tetratricopeptide repeat protein [Ktedonobacteria bacterium brp13]|nr:tetratricopeptide repeat protein [Ktedonobacteria bacterium brp13]